MNTKDLITKAREKGLTIKYLSEITDIKLNTLYNFTYGRGISKEKEEKIRNVLHFLLNDSE